MSLLTIGGTLVVIGVILWAVGQIPMNKTIRGLFQVVVVVVVVLWILQNFGLIPGHVRLT